MTTIIEHAALELTNLCNLECTHCYANSGPREKLTRHMTIERWLEVIDEVGKMGCKSLQFIGGEPTTHPGLPRLLRAAVEAGISQIQVYTNGFSVSDKLMTIFASEGVDMAFSMYGADGLSHDEMTTVPGSFEKTSATIRGAVSRGLNVAVGIVISDTSNIDHELATIAYVEGLGVARDQIGVDRVRSFGRGTQPELGSQCVSELCGRCWSNRIAINDEGKISPCVMSRFVDLGHVDDGLRTIMSSPKYHTFQLQKPIDASDEGDFRETSCKPGSNCRCPKVRLPIADKVVV